MATGTDHAGIATQTKVENALKEDGRAKDSLGREEFVLQACLWRDKHGGIILNQLKNWAAPVTGKEMFILLMKITQNRFLLLSSNFLKKVMFIVDKEW